MAYYPNVELYDLADAVQEVIDCEREEARRVGEVAQVVVNYHRGEGSLVDRLQALQARYDALMAAVEKWSAAPRKSWSRADQELDEAAGLSFELSPRDDEPELPDTRILG